MADEKEEIGVKIAAKTDGLTDGLGKATSAVKGAVSQMEGHFAGIGNAVKNLQTPFLAFSALLAGGAIFKGAVDETLKWNGESIKLARTLGITTEQASVLNVALGDIYSSTDEYLKSAGMMTRQIANGGEGFKRLGIDIKDAQGNLKPTGPLMQEVLEKLNGITQGTARNAAGMAIFGRGWGEAQKLLKLNAEVMEEARAKAEKLNLIVGGDAVAAQGKYKAAMNDVGDVMLGIKLAIGQELMPVLAELAEWFADVAPPVIQGVAFAFKSLVTAVYTVKFAIEYLATYAAQAIDELGTIFGAFGEVTKRVMAGDFKGAMDIAKAASHDQLETEKGYAKEREALYDKLGEKLAKIWDKKEPTSTRVGKQGGADFDPDKGKDKGEQRLREWQAELRQLQDAEAKKFQEQGKWYEMTLAEERDFWQKKLAIGDLSEKERASLIIKTKDLERGIRKEAFEAQLSELHAAEDAARDDLEKKRDLVRKEVDFYRAGTKEEIEARRKLADVERELGEQGLRIQQGHRDASKAMLLAEIEDERSVLSHRVTMGEITAEQQILLERNLIGQKMAAEKEFLEWQLLNMAKTVEDRARINDQLLQLDQQFHLAMEANARQAAEAQKAMWDSYLQPLVSGFQSAIEGMLSGTRRFSDGFRDIWRALGKTVDQAIAKMVTDWIAGEVKKFAITAGIKIKELLLHTATEKAKATTTVASATVGASAAAVEGGAKAASSAASIPVYGWAIAIGAGLAVLAGIKSMMSGLPSAAGGWGQVPQDTLAQIHKNEMVLPAAQAEGLRNLIEGGGGRGESHVHHWNIQAMDASSFAGFLEKNQGALQRVGAVMARNNRTTTASARPL